MNLSDNTCWFCKRDRHNDCMIEIPVRDDNARSQDGPHDCTFGTKMVRCSCSICM